MPGKQNDAPIFPKGDMAPSDYFTGTAWVKILVKNPPVLNISAANVVFEPGCRNNWHRHAGGQMLICTKGDGYFQEKGKKIQLLRAGDVVEILPGVVHWHGATPYNDFTHIAIGPSADKGGPDWLEPVTDTEYNNFQ
ncbi:MAG: cupin domain-containing protein [Ferruginibacter sp.]